MNKLLTTLLACLCFISVSFAQNTGDLRGNVFDKDSGEPVMFGNVLLQGTSFGTNTDENGFFSFSDIPVGEYNLVTTYVGYDSVSVTVNIVGGSITYQRVDLSSGINLGVVDVSARKQRSKSSVQISTVSVTPAQIRSLPSTGGEADIAQYLPVLPGIIFTGDQGGQLYIRGGSPVQNKILLDGMTIYNPFHSIGFFSIFETEAIRSVDVLTGGFNAEYGGRISAIVDIKTRDGNKNRIAGVASVSPFQSKLLLEGPLIKAKEEGGGSTSFLLTGKHSYIDESSKIFYGYAADSTGLPFSYTDLYGKVTFKARNGSNLSLFGFNFTDRVDYPGIAQLDWKNIGGGMNFRLIPSTSKMIVNGVISYSKYEINLLESDDNPRQSSINSFGAGLNFTYFGNDSELKYGFDITGFNTDFTFVNFLGLTFQQEDFTTELAGYLKYKYKWGNLIVEPSIRFQYYASLGESSFEPRFGAKYNINENIRLKFAGGLYSQNLISTVNERDIVNLFVGFLSGPEETIFKPGTTEPTDSKLQKSYHGVAGVEIDLGENIEVNIEPYYKGFTQLININRNKTRAQDPNYATETGEAYGIDFSMRYENKNWYIWTTYSLGYVNRDDGEQVYPTIFDRRHNVNFLATYSFGENRVWEASARWNMGSGFPFTLTQGFYNQQQFDDIDEDVLTSNGDLGVIYSEDRNSGRLPFYHRLDMSLKRRFNFSKNSKLEAILSVTNVYDRENIFYFDRIKYERVNQLPILPSLSLIYSF